MSGEKFPDDHEPDEPREDAANESRPNPLEETVNDQEILSQAGISETVEWSDSDTEPELDRQPSSVEETIESIQERTVGNLESTIEFDAGSEVSPSGSGNSLSIDLDSADPQTDERSDGAAETPVMASPDISQTIDPRELSKEDAAFWGSAAIGASNANQGEDTKLQPAVERSISETKLQIRKRDLAIPTRDPSDESDYRLVRLLGRGGMGNVYVARQASLDRMIAVKVIKPLSKDKRETLRSSGRLEKVELDRRQQFLSEAVVTGDLDHPNIVPIHDIALAADNTLFYAMKRVVGKPWLKTIEELSRDENLDILLKVCDAIAFAHTRGVIHRDIKPENIMLGDFGEVLVMDWGLAIAKPEFEKRDSITFNAGLGGTPAFMAPEMAIGPVDRIGPASDIYLLGATLFYIITGHPPHQADNVSQCIRAVATNEIQPVAPTHQGELMEIALKALATKPKDRFASVKDFQSAIREYRSHAESIAISASADSEYEKALSTKRYESFSRAGHGFEQAIALWDGNEKARQQLAKCRVDHAQAAYANGDFDLGLSLLDPADSNHVELIQSLREGLKLREQRANRLRLFRRLVAASLVVILVGGSVALYFIDRARNDADNQRTIAEEQRDEATAQTAIAEEKTELAKESARQARVQRAIAEEQREKAEKQSELAEARRKEAEVARDDARKSASAAQEAEGQAKESAILAEERRKLAVASEKKAKRALERAEYESYLSQIGLAKARIDSNEFDDARRILRLIRERNEEYALAWEYRYLLAQSNQSRDSLRFESGIVDVDLDRRSPTAFVVSENGLIHRVQVGSPLSIEWTVGTGDITCVSIQHSGEELFVGTKRGELLILDSRDGSVRRRWTAHEAGVTDVIGLDDGRILTASNDRTVAIWSSTEPANPRRAWHIGKVVDVDVISPNSATRVESTIVVTAVSDARSGRAVAWRVAEDGFERLGEFLRHDHPVTSVAISPDGTQVASTDSAGFVAVWNLSDARPTDYESAIESAVESVKTDGIKTDAMSNTKLASVRSPRSVASRFWRAHSAPINAVGFANGGRQLLTASDDYTVGGWNLADGRSEFSLRGHGGWVQTLAVVSHAEFAGILTGSVDGTLRLWDSPRELERGNFAGLANSSENAGNTFTLDAASESVSAQNQPLHDDEILSVRLDHTGKKLITASRDRTARIFRIDAASRSLQPLATIRTDESQNELNEGSEFLAMSSRLDRQHNRLLVGNADSTIRIWDIRTGVQLATLAGTGLNDSFAISADGRRLISGASDPDVKSLIWQVDPMTTRPSVLHRLAGHDQPVTSYAANRNGTLFATGDRGGRCLLWDGKSGRQVGKPIDLLRGYRINELRFSAAGDSIWVASDNGTLTEVGIRARKMIRQLDHDGFVIGCDLSPDGSKAMTLSTVSKDESFESLVRIWDLDSGRSSLIDHVESPSAQSSQSSGTVARINSARFDHDANRVVVCRQSRGGRTGGVTFVDLQAATKRSFAFPTSLGPPQFGLMTSDNQLISLNGEAAFRWSIDGMIHEKSYRPHAAVADACFTPDGKYAVTASRSLRLWETATGTAIDKLETPHQSSLRCMDVSPASNPTGYVVATCGDEGELKVWIWKDAQSGFIMSESLAFDQTRIETLRFLPDGQHLLIGTEDGTITIREVNRLSKESFAWKHKDSAAVSCAAFSADGEWLALGAQDKSVWLIGIDGQSKGLVRTMLGHADVVESICLIGGETQPIRVVTASRDKSCRIWDPRVNAPKESLAEDVLDLDAIGGDATEGSPGNAVTGDAVRERIAWTGEGREVLSLRRHQGGLTAVDVADGGNLVVTAARDGSVAILDAPSDR